MGNSGSFEDRRAAGAPRRGSERLLARLADRMRSFDDFDAWGEAVNGASLQMACDGIETRHWAIGAIDLEGVLLQVASEGAGNICYGGNAHAGTTLFLPLSHADAHVVNGRPLDDASLLAIPRGADFRIHVPRLAHSWCSIALPFDVPGSNSWIVRSPEATPQLKQIVLTIAGTLLGRSAGEETRRAAGRELAAAAAACLASPAQPRSALGRPRLDRTTITRRAMEAIDTAPVLPTASELAAAVGVTSRTLLRTFRESFGVSPKRYLMLRALHAVRRSLSADSVPEATVADVLTRHGIWEFGRFAARYRRHFGELPSETLRQRS